MTEAGAVIASRDSVLVADVSRLCTLAGVVVGVAADVERVQAGWRDAAVVIVDGALAPMVAGAGLPRRAGVVLLTTAAPTPETWTCAVDLGADQVVELPAGERFLADLLVNAGAPHGGSGTCVIVTGACGGAGTTTVAVAVAALASRRGRPTCLVDTDSTGGGIDLLLGVEHTSGLRWPDVVDIDAPVGSTALRAGLVDAGGLAILSADRIARPAPPRQALAAVVRSLRRDGVAVVDTSRCVDPRQFSGAGDLCLLVVPAMVRSVVAAAARVPDLLRDGVDVQLVVRTDRRTGLTPAEVAGAVGAPVAAVVDADRSLAAAADAGRLGSVIARSVVGRALEPVVARLLGSGAS